MISFKKFLGVSETVRTEFDSLNEWRAKSTRLKGTLIAIVQLKWLI